MNSVNEADTQSSPDQPDSAGEISLRGHVIIAGFGVPGRAAADLVRNTGGEVLVLERNPATVHRCEHYSHLHVIEGDCREEALLRRANISEAAMLVVAIPDEAAAIDTTRIARLLNPDLRIVCRCHFVSAGLAAIRAGANEVVVEEQAVAEMLVRTMSGVDVA